MAELPNRTLGRELAMLALLSQRPGGFRHRGRDPQLRGGDLPPNQRNHIPRHARRKGYLMRR